MSGKIKERKKERRKEIEEKIADIIIDRNGKVAGIGITSENGEIKVDYM